MTKGFFKGSWLPIPPNNFILFKVFPNLFFFFSDGVIISIVQPHINNLL